MKHQWVSRENPIAVSPPEVKPYRGGFRPPSDSLAVICGFFEGRVDKSYIYAMRCAGYVKVGMAQDVEKRLASIQAVCPLPVAVIFRRKVNRRIARRIEQSMHYALRDKHHHGEWFTCELDDVRSEFTTARVAAEKHERRVLSHLRQQDYGARLTAAHASASLELHPSPLGGRS